MNKQQSNQMASMRKKLLAAIAMLLVACIMTVSSTYAWFTLSTAPEVKGISTTIGANGNLEMALGTYETFFGTDIPESYVGSAMGTASVPEANITWGNLVDLSDGSYGLDKITLYPSRLNSIGTINRTSPLQFPVYGADGRVSELSDATLVGSYDSVSGGFINTPGQTATGVSGIGSASSMSKRAFAVMNGKSAMISYKNAAQNAAKDAIRLYAGTLAAIALEYDNAEATTAVPEADIAVLKSLIAKLYDANNNISESMKSAVLVVLAAANTIDETAWQAGTALANGKDIAEFVTAIKAAGSQVDGVDLSAISSLDSWVADYQAIQGKLDAASAALPESGAGEWGDIETSVRALLVASGIKIGGYTIAEVKADYKENGMGGNVVKDLFNKMNTNALTFSFSATSGIFADIAKLTGEYTSSMTFPEGTTVEGLDLNMLGSKPVAVESSSMNATKGDLGLMFDVLDPLDAPSADPNAAVTLTDTYGYIIDLLFRTNATESDLLLQTEGANRYMDGAVEETMGNGSNITFTVNAEYSEAKIKGLAAGIRVIFFDNAGAILGVATLDVNDGTVAGGAYKMDLRLVEYSINSDGVIAPGAAKADAKLCALTANVKKGVSALVYLDGDVIDNSHAGTNEGLEATVNLQFASSVELKPMENADLMGE